jgi:hypothetical protein
VDHLWSSNISNSFTPDQGTVGHKYIKSFLWWHLQMTVISSDIHEQSRTPHTTSNYSSHWPLKLTELHAFIDWMLNFIKTVSSHSRWPSMFLNNTERKLISSSHITLRMVECTYLHYTLGEEKLCFLLQFNPRYSCAVMLCFPHSFPGNSIYCSVFLLTGS